MLKPIVRGYGYGRNNGCSGLYNRAMATIDIAAQRLRQQHLLQDLPDPVSVVRHLGAVQSQDFIGGKWALGLRCDTTDEEVTRLFNEGKILRTHILRPTWHFVLPEDIRWMQALTAPRVQAFSKYYYKKVEIDETIAKKAHAALKKSLKGGNYLTKADVGEVFKNLGLEDINGLRFGFLLGHAELEALICSGPMKGKQQTYALLEERAPGAAKSMPYDKALAELTRRYFDGHGPGQIQDLAWWSSLTVAEVKRGIELCKLKSFEAEGKTYFYSREAGNSLPSPVVHLLPNYDEYFIAFKDRSAFSAYRTFKLSRDPADASLFNHIMTLDGQVAGGWKRKINKEFTVDLTLFTKLNAAQQKALDRAAKRLEKFSELPTKIS